ncbi:hypothetical protein [Candidatus Allofournierella merdipullorum]|uniref:hypothetical protein n=1 Tax=Candidatus Allofournierella merdipullorum TaxID=2838595 RepID=UPI002A85CB45|nr:hypothetical protein [Candidatus Fournierella merdipullorum]
MFPRPRPSAPARARAAPRPPKAKGRRALPPPRIRAPPAESEKTAASSAGKSAASGSSKTADNKTATSKATGGETPAGTQTNTGKTGTNQTDTGKTGTSTDSKTPAATPAPGSNAGTGHNPNEGGAIGGGNTTIPGDGSWAVDGGNAEFVERPTPAPVAPEPDSNIGTGVNPNEGGAIGGGNTTIPGDGSWAVDGGNAEYSPAPLPPEPVA